MTTWAYRTIPASRRATPRSSSSTCAQVGAGVRGARSHRAGCRRAVDRPRRAGLRLRRSVTVVRMLPGDLGDVIERVPRTESAPPAYLHPRQGLDGALRHERVRDPFAVRAARHRDGSRHVGPRSTWNREAGSHAAKPLIHGGRSHRTLANHGVAARVLVAGQVDHRRCRARQLTPVDLQIHLAPDLFVHVGQPPRVGPPRGDATGPTPDGVPQEGEVDPDADKATGLRSRAPPRGLRSQPGRA